MERNPVSLVLRSLNPLRLLYKGSLMFGAFAIA